MEYLITNHKSQKFQKTNNKIIQKQSQMTMIKKYLRCISPEERQKIIDNLRPVITV